MLDQIMTLWDILDRLLSDTLSTPGPSYENRNSEEYYQGSWCVNAHVKYLYNQPTSFFRTSGFFVSIKDTKLYAMRSFSAPTRTKTPWNSSLYQESHSVSSDDEAENFRKAIWNNEFTCWAQIVLFSLSSFYCCTSRSKSLIILPSRIKT